MPGAVAPIASYLQQVPTLGSVLAAPIAVPVAPTVGAVPVPAGAAPAPTTADSSARKIEPDLRDLGYTQGLPGNSLAVSLAVERI
jgi:hypothetical protein